MILLTCIRLIGADQVVSKRPKRRNEETQRLGFNLIALNQMISNGICHASIWHVLSLKVLVDLALLVDLGYPSDVLQPEDNHRPRMDSFGDSNQLFLTRLCLSLRTWRRRVRRPPRQLAETLARMPSEVLIHGKWGKVFDRLDVQNMILVVCSFNSWWNVQKPNNMEWVKVQAFFSPHYIVL